MIRTSSFVAQSESVEKSNNLKYRQIDNNKISQNHFLRMGDKVQ